MRLASVFIQLKTMNVNLNFARCLFLSASLYRYRYNNSQAFYEPLLGEHVALYSRENNARVLTIETDNDVEYTDA